MIYEERERNLEHPFLTIVIMPSHLLYEKFVHHGESCSPNLYTKGAFTLGIRDLSVESP
jgi:hypothetical protein